MWSDRDADPPGCPGSGRPAAPAPVLPSGFPDGRAVCDACLDFVAVTDAGALAPHDAFRGASSAQEARERADWFNTFGWTR
ncbi:hypothetical protein [Microbacterium sp. BK668]|uniref:hypothetical protein n=1 Tax=Microbacterium sp. BK668 TaxID=2512118 RepID=UPI00105ECC9D|nr:hypothetical protein [Microbacterium sp. BK668]TDN92453.1 hypothetical protein EV279_1974 [Microbacterium sp. BK668]